MDSDTHMAQSGYYLVTIRPNTPGLLLSSNNERALIISSLQDSLTSRSLLEESYYRAKLASHIDLLAFSILKEGVQLVAFSIAKNSLTVLAESIISKLTAYRSEFGLDPPYNGHPTKPTTVLRRLAGPHDALALSVQLHSNHPDWEFDRYSSIGFYLHDRRGDWVHLWRLSHLYENSTNNYLRLMEQTLYNELPKPTHPVATTESYATLKHE